MSVAIAIAMMMAGIISVTLEGAVAGLVLLGAMLIARHAVSASEDPWPKGPLSSGTRNFSAFRDEFQIRHPAH